MYPTVSLGVAALFLVGGLVALAWSSDCLVADSSALARRFGVSSFVVGVVLVGFGTSLPELAVSTLASVDGHGDLALANVYGSNAYNIAVILGIAALVRPLRLRRTHRRGAVPILALTLVVGWGVLLVTDGVSRAWGLVFLLLFVPLVPLVTRLSAAPKGRAPAETDEKALKGGLFARLVLNLGMIVASSYLVVWGAVAGARQLGVPELVVGLTVVAAGTSLPELATTLAAIRRADAPLALGNIIGSNLFNALVIVGVSALVRPIAAVSPALVWRDVPVALLVTLLLMRRRLTRCWGLALVVGFAAYSVACYLCR